MLWEQLARRHDRVDGLMCVVESRSIRVLKSCCADHAPSATISMTTLSHMVVARVFLGTQAGVCS
jgi:hypothetical protein